MSEQKHTQEQCCCIQLDTLEQQEKFHLPEAYAAVCRMNNELTKQRDVLLDEVAKLKADLHEVQQRRHDEYRVRAIGKAVYRACEELPEGFDLHIELEKGAGTVRLYDQDGDEVTEEFNGDYLNHDIDNAINYAIASVKGGAA